MTGSAESLSDELPVILNYLPTLGRGCALSLWKNTEREVKRGEGEGKVRGDILHQCYHWNYKITEGIEGSFIYSAFTNTKFTLNGVSIPSLRLYTLSFCPEQIFMVVISS